MQTIRHSGTGPLQGTTSLDIGTNAGKGVALFTNLRIDAAGTKQLTASSTPRTAAQTNNTDRTNDDYDEALMQYAIRF